MDFPTIALAVIAILVVFAAFFSGSETAMTAVSRSLMQQMEQDGNRAARRVNRLLAARDRLIGALLLGHTLVVVAAAGLATSLALWLCGTVGVVYAVAALTVVLVLFGEVLPKTYALYHANQVALGLSWPVRITVMLLSPLVHAVEIVTRLIFRLFGASYATKASIETAMMELRGAIEVHAAEDEVEEERKMLRSILDLDDVGVGDVMTHRKSAATIDAALSAAEIVEHILKTPYTRLPLWRDNPDNIVGVIHAKDVLRAVSTPGAGLDKLNVTELAAEPWFIPDSTTLLEQLTAFRKRREHFALVVDEYGALLGIVTLEDILEEIVGDIADEHDVAVAGVRPQSNGSYVVEGTVTLRDLNREFDWRLPDEEAATIAGLLLHESRQIPNAGQVFRFFGFRFEVLKRHRNQITLVRITPTSAEPATEKD